jgi:ring-1,2-phenylacetyl-CoA epoxidase subunit PaaC
MTHSPVATIALSLGDDELILGHRHSEWTGYAPHIEEDVAFSSIAQDEIGHAAAFYAIVSKATGDDPDQIAFGRDPDAYRNALICERPNGDWAYTLARHWLYDVAEELRLESLESSADTDLSSLARKMRREERYHLLHADMWMQRIAHGPVEGRTKLVEALRKSFPDALGLFEPFEDEDAALDQQILTVSSKALEERYVERILGDLDRFGLPSPERKVDGHQAEFVASSSGDLIEGDDAPETVTQSVTGPGRRGEHSEDFHAIWDVMTRTVRANPGATW